MVLDPRMSAFLAAAGDLAEAQLLGEVTAEQVADAIAGTMLATRADPDMVVRCMFEIAQQRLDQLGAKRTQRRAIA